MYSALSKGFHRTIKAGEDWRLLPASRCAAKRSRFRCPRNGDVLGGNTVVRLRRCHHVKNTFFVSAGGADFRKIRQIANISASSEVLDFSCAD